MPRKKNNQKSSSAISAKSKTKRADPDSGHVSPVESSTQQDDLNYGISSSTDWKDDVINYYRKECAKAWKCFLAATLERYHMFLELKRRCEELEVCADSAVITLNPMVSEEHKQMLALQIENERAVINENTSKEDDIAVVRFLDGLQRIDAGEDIATLIPIDLGLGLQHFQSLVEEGTTKGQTGGEESLEHSFTGSVDSQDSACVVTPRERTDLKKRNELDILHLSSGKMKTLHLFKESKTTQSSQIKEKKPPMISTTTQYDESDISLASSKLPQPTAKINFATQTSTTNIVGLEKSDHTDDTIPKKRVSKGNGALSEAVTVKAVKNPMMGGRGVSGEQKKGGLLKANTVKDQAEATIGKEGIGVAGGQKTPGNKGKVGTTDVVSANAVKDKGKEGIGISGEQKKPVRAGNDQAPKQAISMHENASSSSGNSYSSNGKTTSKAAKGFPQTEWDEEKAKQIEEDEKFARELAKRWGQSESSAFRRAPSPAPEAVQPPVRMRYDSLDGSWENVNRPRKPPNTDGQHGAAGTAAGTWANPYSDIGTPPATTEDGIPVTYSTRTPARKFSKESYLNKTGICWTFKEKGSCPWGDECIFAHGRGELRALPEWFNKDNMSNDANAVKKAALSHPEPCASQLCGARLQYLLWKTMICKQWLAGRCSFEGCKFAHGKAELKPLPKYELCQRNLNGKCGQKSTECVYAHSKQELRPAPPKFKASVALALSKISTRGAAGGGASGRGSIGGGTGGGTPTGDYKWIKDRVVSDGPPIENLWSFEDCIICADDFSTLVERFTLPCGHNSFHSQCISRWINERDPSCPICREPADMPGMFKPPRGAKPAEYPHLSQQRM